jgi:hypothetical protein
MWLMINLHIWFYMWLRYIVVENIGLTPIQCSIPLQKDNRRWLNFAYLIIWGIIINRPLKKTHLCFVKMIMMQRDTLKSHYVPVIVFLNYFKIKKCNEISVLYSEWGDMFIRGLLFRWASTIKIQLSVLV